MTKLFIILLSCVALTAFGQGPEEKVLYVVDSIPVIEEPENGQGTLEEKDVQEIAVVTNKDAIQKFGYNNLDKIIFVTTKEYFNRPEDIKKIPTTKAMDRRGRIWYLKGATIPYSGPFIDYFMNGKKEGEGVLKNGEIEGLRNLYFPNGQLSYYRHYVKGVPHGESKEYFMNGALQMEGAYKDGKEDGLWKEWYSTGKLKRQLEFKEGEAIGVTKELTNYEKFLTNGSKLFKEENYTGAVKQYDKAVELRPDYSDAYFYRGTAYLYDFKFDEAIKDFDKVLELEPLHMESFTNRAFTRLRKHELGGSRTLKKTNGVTIMAGKPNVELSPDEKEKICADLNRGIELGDYQTVVLEARKKYCE